MGCLESDEGHAAVRRGKPGRPLGCRWRVHPSLCRPRPSSSRCTDYPAVDSIHSNRPHRGRRTAVLAQVAAQDGLRYRYCWILTMHVLAVASGNWSLLVMLKSCWEIIFIASFALRLLKSNACFNVSQFSNRLFYKLNGSVRWVLIRILQCTAQWYTYVLHFENKIGIPAVFWSNSPKPARRRRTQTRPKLSILIWYLSKSCLRPARRAGSPAAGAWCICDSDTVNHSSWSAGLRPGS